MQSTKADALNYLIPMHSDGSRILIQVRAIPSTDQRVLD